MQERSAASGERHFTGAGNDGLRTPLTETALQKNISLLSKINNTPAQ